MTLVTNKSVTLQGQSMIDNVQVLSMTATITTDGGNTTYTTSVFNDSVYAANHEAVRKDADDFQDLIWAVEDEIEADKPAVKQLSAAVMKDEPPVATPGFGNVELHEADKEE